MPVPLRSIKAEAKYNVTTDFPHLGLHSAAATGNIGLVKYALSHGQPINSVLDGVLPLHAACSGGNDLVVKLLIQNGADVNAPRLPRRYFNDRNRDTSAPIVGTSGSTPLHFAAANGHTTVISTLLHHGAHAHRADKHGVTPEMLARQNGELECADLLRDWLLNKDKDLRERRVTQGDESGSSTSRDRQGTPTDTPEGSSRKRVQMKRSIDNALTIWKSSPSPARPVAPPSPTARCQSNPPSPPTPFGEYSFYPVDSVSNTDPSERRPSLPQLSLDPPAAPTSPGSSYRRPRSAGMDAEPSPTQRTPCRKLGSKYSLLHLFKKGQTSPEPPSSPSPYLTPYSNKLSAASASALPIPIPGSSSPSPSPNNIPLPSSSSPSESSPLAKYRYRMGSDPNTRGPPATEMHHTLAQQQRDRSGSGASRSGTLFDDEVIAERSSSPLIPPGILRSHNRSSSSGQTQLGAKSSFRALRFEASSSSISKAFGGSRFHKDGSGPAVGLRGSNSAASLKRASSPRRRIGTQIPESAPAATADFDQGPTVVADQEEDEEEYGKEITRPHDVVQEPNSRLAALRMEGRPRGQSFASSSSSLSPEAAAADDDVDFPFSINQPPPVDVEGRRLAVPLGDNRSRGDSVSSVSTDGSNNPQLSSSGTTGSSITTPGLSPLHTTLRDHRPSLSRSKPPELNLSEPSPDTATAERFTLPSDTLQVGLSERRSRNPLDINIRSISSHAQAEALVQRAQKSILEMADQLSPPDEPLKSAGLDGGWTPLSAKLAAYGESLAIERRLKKEEEERRLQMESAEEDKLDEFQAGDESPTEVVLRDGVQSAPVDDSRVGKSRRTGLDRQFSLEHSYDSRAKVHVPKRPNTSGGISSENLTSPDAQGSSFSSPAYQSQSASTADFSPGGYTERRVATSPPPMSPCPHTPPHPEDADRYHTMHSHTPELTPTDPAPTAPTPANGALPGRDPRDNARHIASASKLTRMGFATPDVSGAGRPQAGAKRFGLKSLMQTLTGKS